MVNYYLVTGSDAELMGENCPSNPDTGEVFDRVVLAQSAKPTSLLPNERECCGTFKGSRHRSTCEKGKAQQSQTEVPHG